MNAVAKRACFLLLFVAVVFLLIHSFGLFSVTEKYHIRTNSITVLPTETSARKTEGLKVDSARNPPVSKVTQAGKKTTIIVGSKHKPAYLSEPSEDDLSAPKERTTAAPIEINLVTYMHILTAHRNLTDAEKRLGSKFHAMALKRKAEVYLVVQKNLNHPLVKSFHVLVENKSVAEEAIRKQALQNADKIVIHENGRPATYKDIFRYISDNFVNKTAMFVCEDVYLGKGYEKINPRTMRDSKIMYALTRHDSPEWRHCQRAFKQSTCDTRYGGSHDAYMVHLKEPIIEAVLKEVDYETFRWRIEGRIIWAFKTLMKFCVLDPCQILELFHLHCSGLHASAAERSNTDLDGRKSVWLGYSNRLTC